MREAQRIFNKKLLLLLIFLLAVNFLLFRQEQQRRFAFVFQEDASFSHFLSVYEEQLSQAAAAPDLAQGLKDARAQMEDLQSRQEWGLPYTTLQAFTIPYLEYAAGYPAYLEKVQENARIMSTLPVFTKGSAFSGRNLTKTAADFLPLQQSPLAPGNYLGAEALLEYRMTDFLLLLFLLYLAQAFLAERKLGLWEMVYATAGGRGRLAAKRVLLFAAAGVAASLLFYGGQFLSCRALFGSVDLTVPAQSVPALGRFPEAVSLGSFFTRFYLVKAGGLLLISFILWQVMTAFSDLAIGFAMAAAVLAAEYALFALLPVQSLFNPVKYINLLSYFFTDKLFENYLNLNLFGWPVNNRRLMETALPFALMAAAVIQFFLLALRRPEKKKTFLTVLFDRARRLSDRFFCLPAGRLSEVRKFLFTQKGLVFLALFFWLVNRLYPVTQPILPVQNSTVVEYLLDRWEGPVTEQTLAEIAEERAALDQEYADFADLSARYEAGEATLYEYTVAKAMMHQVDNRNVGLSDIEGRVQRLLAQQQEKGIEPWLFNYRYVLRLFLNLDDQYRNGLLAILAVVLLTCGLYAQEESARLRPLLRQTEKGRGRLVWRKQAILLFASLFVAGILYGCEYGYMLTKNGCPGLSAPIQSLPWFAPSSLRITMRQMLAGVLGLRFLCIWTAAQLTALLSSLMARKQTAAAAAFLLVAGPSALWTAGVKQFGFLSLARYCAVIDTFQLVTFDTAAGLRPYLLILFIGLAAAAGSTWRWVRTR